MASPNWANQTIWTGDNLAIMRGMNSESVDLIYLDPPFNSKANYAAPIGSKAAGAEFKDTWTLRDVDAEWINLIEAKHPALYRVILAAMTNSDKSYLAYMAARLLEMRRVLKPTGSIYLHCDPTMSHYLKLTMDAIFGRRRFQNEVIWKRTSGHSDSKTMGAVHDVLLHYAISDAATYNVQFAAYADDYVARRYKHSDPDGRRFMDDNLTAKGLQGGGYEYEYKGVQSLWRVPEERMEALDREGRLYFTRRGGIRIKRYLDEMKGLPINDLWADIPPVNSRAKERTGYPTQKPLALLERIIAASSDPDDMILDPFCGCATACIAAQSVDHPRQWVGIDVAPKAAELVQSRMRDELGLFFQGAHRTDIPRRTDLGQVIRYNDAKNKRHLYGEQGGYCMGCAEHFPPRNLEVDHIVPRAKGGTDHLGNLQLLCGACNRVKGDRGMEYLRVKLQMAA